MKSVETIFESSRFEAGNKARDINLAECHGTGGMAFFPKKKHPNRSRPSGTALGDPIEVGALKNVMEPRDTTLALTSSKSNIGHLEGSAGASQFFRFVVHETEGSKEECLS